MKDVTAELKKIKNKSLLVIFPHPDDEAVMAGGLIQRVLMLGWKVKVVCLTKGGRGKIHINGNGKSAVEIREKEFAAAMTALGVSDWEIGDWPDGELRRTRAWRERVLRLITDLQPGLVVTYDHSGVSGHPDHIALSLEVFRVLRDSSASFGMTRVVLWWPSLSGKPREMMVEPRVEDLLSWPNLKLRLTIKEAMIKWQAISAHKSQGWGRIKMWPMCLGWLLKYRYEEFVEADLKKKYPFRYVKFEF